MAVGWSWPTVGPGFVVALVFLILAVILGALRIIGLEAALVVVAICSVRL